MPAFAAASFFISAALCWLRKYVSSGMSGRATLRLPLGSDLPCPAAPRMVASPGSSRASPAADCSVSSACMVCQAALTLPQGCCQPKSWIWATAR